MSALSSDVWSYVRKFLSAKAYLTLKEVSSSMYATYSDYRIWQAVPLGVVTLKLPVIPRILRKAVHVDSRFASPEAAMMSACLRDTDFTMAAWCAAVGEITKADVLSNKMFLFGRTVFGMDEIPERLTVLQWLIEKFGLTAADISSGRNWFLRAACVTGNLAIAKWLTKQFKLKLPRYWDQVNRAARQRHTDVTDWLIDNYEELSYAKQ